VHDFHGKARRSQAVGQPELRAQTVPQQIKVARLTLKAPARPDRTSPAVTVTALLATEVQPPADEEPLEWLLMTNLPVETAAQLRSGLIRYFHFYNARCRHSLAQV
jgi:hypothetical protein